ncbi:hypothetical protein K466DRAFT_551672 [Polyporus arcularius HHB13444]|uniref:Methyltransferase domain-containing protein n=1 Tax=Polyporus arcularius HHB13444 TaxID=1314778 RepID=A0A5C3P8W8_9APHY|nr:hypothetical protein K466DRAFT_551672 [Polyporus arcularius HHB13444]
MSVAGATPTPNFTAVLPLRGTEALLHFDEDQLEFYKKATGIDDLDALKRHLISVQREAYAVRPYTTIVNFYFTDLGLSHVPGYRRMIELGQTRRNPILVDVGCCFGQDLRKAIADGYPQESVLGTDIVPEFWDLGHRLFNTTQETFPIPFLAGDIFDPAFLEPTPPIYTAPSTAAPALSAVRTLNELRGHVSVICVCAIFHLFDTEEAQLRLARALAPLLSFEPGSMIIGWHNGRHEKGYTEGYALRMFCHSPESWTALWDGDVFENGTVRVGARLVEKQRRYMKEGVPTIGMRTFLEWSVTRISPGAPPSLGDTTTRR